MCGASDMLVIDEGHAANEKVENDTLDKDTIYFFRSRSPRASIGPGSPQVACSPPRDRWLLQPAVLALRQVNAFARLGTAFIKLKTHTPIRAKSFKAIYIPRVSRRLPHLQAKRLSRLQSQLRHVQPHQSLCMQRLMELRDILLVDKVLDGLLKGMTMPIHDPVNGKKAIPMSEYLADISEALAKDP
jgi:hypothetical protein